MIESTPLLRGRRLPLVELALLSMAFSLVAASALMITAALPLIAESFAVSNTVVSSALYVNWIVVALSTPPWGAYADARGRKFVLVLSLALVMVGSGVCGGATTFGTFLVGRIIQGLGEGGAQSVPTAIIRDVVEDEVERTSAIATMYQIWPIVTICSPSVGGIIASQIGWRWIFAFLFAWSGANALGVVVYIAETREIKQDTTSQSELKKLADSLHTVCTQPHPMLYLAFLIIIRGGVPATMLTYYPFLLGETMSTSMTGLVIGAIGFFAIVGACASKALNRLLSDAEYIVNGTLTVYLVCTIAVAVAAIFIRPCVGDCSWIVALSVAGTFNTIICIVDPAGISILMGMVQPELAGALSGLHNGALMGLYAVVSACAGVVLGLYPTTLTTAFLLFSIWAFIALLSYVIVLIYRAVYMCASARHLASSSYSPSKVDSGSAKVMVNEHQTVTLTAGHTNEQIPAHR